VKHWCEHALVRAVALGIRPLPMHAVRRCGVWLGRLAFVVDKGHRRTALQNLEAAFPGRTAQERTDLAKQVFEHCGSVLLELLRFGAYSRDEMLAAVEFDGDERAAAAYQQGRGVLFFTGHFGYWERHAIVHALRHQPVSVLARPLDNPRLHRLLERTRTTTGNAVIYRQGAVRRMLQDLANNRGVAMLIDQHLHTPDIVHVDFFNRQAATTSALAALALRTGAAVIPVFALPLPDGRYRLVYEHPVTPPAADSPDAVREFTQRCTDVLEMYVRRHPEQWLWMHRRWRDVPAKLGRESFKGDSGGAP
jgi:KDO2-lipid IV(A) lauroyltransferase